MADIRTTEGREELRRHLDDPEFCGEFLVVGDGPSQYEVVATEVLPTALDGLDIAEDREEHMGSDKIHGAYCLNCLELSRRWQAWKEEP